jgi:hypothetical protein
MILSELLQPTQILVAYRVPFMKSRAFKFSGTDFGHVMGQFHTHCIF